MFNNQEERGLPQDNPCVFNVLFCTIEFLGDFYGTLLQRGFHPNFILVLVICQTCQDGFNNKFFEMERMFFHGTK